MEPAAGAVIYMMSFMGEGTQSNNCHLSHDSDSDAYAKPGGSFPRWQAKHPIYAFDWSPHSAQFCSLAVASFITDAHSPNVVQTMSISTPTQSTFTDTHSSAIPFPATKLAFSPHHREEELFAVSGDGLRLYRRAGNAYEMALKLLPAQIATSPNSSTAASRRPSDANIITANPNYSPSASAATPSRNSPAPITSFDWNRVDSSLLVTSSYDTTCAVWNLTTGSVKTQLIAHDKEVFDVAFNPKSADIFASVGAEGSIRLFDTRALDHSTILYETFDAQPLLRLAWNPLDTNYVACFGVDGQQVVIVDTRSAAVPVAVLSGHSTITSIKWAPHNSGWLVVADGADLRLWDVSASVSLPSWHLPTGTATIQNICWPTTAPDWFAYATTDQIQLIKL